MNEGGKCMCGCGRTTRLAKSSSRTTGDVRGKPRRYVQGHTVNRYERQTRPGPWYDVDMNTGCWIFNRAKDQTGYGQVCVKGKKYMAHRVVWEGTKGTIPTGMVIDHLCANPSCVNPDHLEAVSRGENQKRGGYAHSNHA